MKTNRAFTLIEVMVVLSILAIIAILAYNFFGSTMKEAVLKQQVTKIYNDFRVLDDASQKFFMDTGAWPANEDDLVTSGILKSLPVPPYPGSGAYYLYTSYGKYPDHYDAGDTTTNDGAWTNTWGDQISDELCGAFNELMGLPAVPVDNTASQVHPAIYSCCTWSAAANTDNEFIAFFELD